MASGPLVGGAVAPAADRIGGALWGLFIADAMAMPAHWYYGGTRQVASDYGGPIRSYVKPKMELQGSIMNKSSTGGGGRGSDQGTIIGRVINHGKADYWTSRGSYHYHCTLQKGENTLEAQLVRLVCRNISENAGCFSPERLRSSYVKFMQTPESHNDCYASTCHRMFFANLTKGKAPENCPDNDNHNVDTIDGLIMAVPVMLARWKGSLSDVQADAVSCMGVTRNSQVLPQYSSTLGAVLLDILAGKPIGEALESKAGHGLASMVKTAKTSQDPVVA
jgi:ADP-ribosylglycohydrolase